MIEIPPNVQKVLDRKVKPYVEIAKDTLRLVELINDRQRPRFALVAYLYGKIEEAISFPFQATCKGYPRAELICLREWVLLVGEWLAGEIKTYPAPPNELEGCISVVGEYILVVDFPTPDLSKFDMGFKEGLDFINNIPPPDFKDSD